MLRALSIVLSVLLGAALFSGCGDEEPPVLAVVLTEYRVTGADGGALVAPRGKVRLLVSNEGAIHHDLAVFQGEKRLGLTALLAPGQSQTLDVTLGSGTYDFFCTVHLHAALGMHIAVTPLE